MKSINFYRHFSSVRVKEKVFPRKIFSGVQPTGALHIGNYFGAVKKWVDLQNEGNDCTFCVVDLHSITLPQTKLAENTMTLAATLLGIGIDPAKATLFLQSSVTQHSEFCWILGCLTCTMARLAHLPQYKEKSKLLKDIPLGLFMYPVLQAADIMLYKATHIPVGEDQVQHLQLTHHLVNVFNSKFGTTFPPCEPIVAPDAARLKSLRDPTKKMSKSDVDQRNAVYLNDPPAKIKEKVKKAITDFESRVTFDPEKRPGVANLITVHSLASNLTPQEICKQAEGIDTGKYKLVVADALTEHLLPIQKRIEDYLSHPEYIVKVLKDGGERASEVAERTLKEVKGKIDMLDLDKISLSANKSSLKA